jgi:hypothetical protein
LAASQLHRPVNNDIGTAGAERLAGVLPQCAALAHLDLYYNWIGDAGAQRLTESRSGLEGGLFLDYEEELEDQTGADEGEDEEPQVKD